MAGIDVFALLLGLVILYLLFCGFLGWFSKRGQNKEVA